MNTHDKIELPPLPEFDRLSSMHADDVVRRLQEYGRKCARSAIEADRKRRGEPVGYIMPTAIKQLKAGGNAIVGGVSQGCDVPIYIASQPDEPVNVPLDKAGAVGRAFSLVRRLKDGEPVEDELRQVIRQIAAEPVKSYLTVKYDDKGDCLYVCCDSNEPADAKEDDKGILYRRAISDGRLVGITIMNFIGRHAESSDDVPQPAEPVKIPSDEELLDIFYEVDSSRNLELGDFALWKAFARALLARYSHLTATTHKSYTPVSSAQPTGH